MRSSIRVNNDLSFDELTRLVVAAEAAGIDQAWVSNDLLLRSAPVLIGALAARTERIRLGIGIMNPYTVHPTELAMLAATAQEVSGGRFLLGLGAGAPEFLAWAGLERPAPMGTTRGAVAALRRMLGHTDVADADLPGWWSDEAFLRFEVPDPVPVYIGAMGPQMRTLAGRIADGALPLLYPPETFAAARADVLAGLSESRRDLEAFDLPACVWVSVGSAGEREDARRALAEKLAYYGPSISARQLAAAGLTAQDFEPAAQHAYAGRMAQAAALIDDRMLALGIAGSPEEVIERCLALRALGADHLSFGPPLGPDPVRAIELLGREVVPHLEAAG